MASYTILCVSILLFVTLVSTEDFQTPGIAKQNVYRAKHRAPKLVADKSLQGSAQSWADYLATTNQFMHSDSGGAYGENIYMSAGNGNLTAVVLQAVESWYGEVSKYNFDKPGYTAGTGHFTQLVWKSSKSVGIGASMVPDPKYGHNVTVVAQYTPAGNIVTSDGRYFRDNVLRPK